MNAFPNRTATDCSRSENIMNAFHLGIRRATRFLRGLALGGLTAWLFAAPFVAQATVPVDQSPLVIQQPIPPNLVLMLDDSGSMGSDYMPDWGYIPGGTSADNLRYYGHNGTYYNPNVIYSPPPTADGGSYPDSPGLGDAFRDGFTDPSNTDDVTRYYGSYPYYTQLTANVNSSYDPTLGCASGDSLSTDPNHLGECQHAESPTYTYYKPNGSYYNLHLQRQRQTGPAVAKAGTPLETRVSVPARDVHVHLLHAERGDLSPGRNL